MMADPNTAVGTFTDNGADQQLRCDSDKSGNFLVRVVLLLP